MATIKARKQGNSIMLTVPAEFHVPAGTRLKPTLTQDGIFYKFVKSDDFFDFSADILDDLIAQGYSGKELSKRFREVKKQIPSALNMVAKEAEKGPILSEDEARKEVGL